MYIGVLAGLLAALGQSCSYIFSRKFVVKHGSAVHLLVFSQVLMGIFSLIMLPFVMPRNMFDSYEFVNPLLLCAVAYVVGQGCFFLAIREVEASRLSSLLGLKLLVLALINILCFSLQLSAMQWGAVICCVCAAMMMNWSGAAMSWSAVLLLLFCCIGYSVSDIAGRALVLSVPGEGLVQKALTGTALCYLFLGIVALPLLPFFKPSRKAVVSAVPFALCWFGAMIFLFACFGAIGTVFGNIIQSSRGLISVLIGALLLRAGYVDLETKVDRRAFLRRVVAAVLMMVAIGLYSYACLKRG